jgi:hypothetical protein
MKLLPYPFAIVALLASGMLACRTATADHHPRCDNLSGELSEDPGTAAQCPPDHPACFVGSVDGHHFHASTLFYSESSAPPPATSPGWLSYSGVTTYTTTHGSIITRETGVVSTVPIAEAIGRASLSMEVITGGTGAFDGATGYFFVTGFVVDPERHVSSHVTGKVCRR